MRMRLGNKYYWDKKYKLKRPKKGYNTNREREFAQWSGVSEWEAYFGNEKIGQIGYIGTPMTDWTWSIKDTNLKGDAPTRNWAFQDLISAYEKGV